MSKPKKPGRATPLPATHPNAGAAFEASMKWQKGVLRVRMTSPATSHGTPIAGFRYLLHTTLSPATKKPEPLTGNYLPATFEAEVNGCTATFTLDLVRKSVKKNGKVLDSVQITALQCHCVGGSFVADDLPLPLMRRLAIEASTFAAWKLPPNFAYDIGGLTWRTDSSGLDFHIVGPGGIPVEVAQDLGTQTDLLRAVARLYHSAPYGSKYLQIAKAFGYKTEWAKKWVARAKQELPELFEEPAKQSKRKATK